MTESSYWRRTMDGARLNRRTFLRSAAVTGAGAAAFLAGCRGTTNSTPSPEGASPIASTATALFANPAAKKGGVLGDQAREPSTGWDIHKSIADNTIRATENTHIKLIRHDYTGNKGPWKAGNEEAIMGELAEKWESPDPLTYNFTLRQGLNWPDLDPMNGRPMKAADVAYTMKHALEPDSLVQEWVFNNIKSVTAIDEHTVQFRRTTRTGAGWATWTHTTRASSPRACTSGRVATPRARTRHAAAAHGSSRSTSRPRSSC